MEIPAIAQQILFLKHTSSDLLRKMESFASKFWKL